MRDKNGTKERVVVEFTDPVRIGEFNMGLTPVALVICKVCGAAVPILTLHEPVEAEMQPTMAERPVSAIMLHTEWHRLHNHGGEYK
jgi:hypothetical protein